MSCVHCSKASRLIHPDITVIVKPPDKREIVVDQIRELKQDVFVVPNESEKKAYIVHDADLMNKNAQNAFLQILEEPPAHAVFILKTENPAALLPTVRSRCMELKANSAMGSPDAATEMASELFSAMESGNTQLMALMFRLEKLDKDEFGEFLTAAHRQVAVLLRAGALLGSGHISTGIPLGFLARAELIFVKAGEMLDLNVSTGHISGMICANLLQLKVEV